MKHKIIFVYYNGDKLYWTGDFWSLNPKKALDYDDLVNITNELEKIRRKVGVEQTTDETRATVYA